MALDEATRALCERMAAQRWKPLHEMTVAEARALPKDLAAAAEPPSLPPVSRAEDHHVPAPGGGFAVRVFVPRGAVRGVLVYYHGGGWVIGELEQYELLGRLLARETGCAVVVAEYRLAPEHPYPAAPEDAWSALVWAAERTESLAGAGAPLVVAGDSAGGNLAAVVAQRARDEGGPELAAQVLVYPATDADLDRPSYREPENQLLVSRDSMVWFWNHYLPDPARRTEPAAAPLRAATLAGLPPAIVLTAGHDPLRDEGEEYARRLEAAGVPVRAKRFADQMHGFFTLAGVLPGSAEGIGFVARQLDPLLRPKSAKETS
ncbi:alpha/beta hydrolase [Amycolatopsis sp. VS8301801F10]|uniref:alpha/beta hydrolase n=1 Tax=Amycolatopsis sp. VS8301801F10 TaxID=2652442 RepID=UPI0038FC400A